ncbi:MAG: hypothetical protein B6D63_01920 [Candidatus Latescibacteria bacterium 4484_7]|nr:MAG: hypothetical protein B6D63_01920 [Candidatus Latescibacteria bacterium 4484_7]
MASVYVIAEHRKGELGDVTLENIALAKELGEKYGLAPKAIVLASSARAFAEELADYIPEVLTIEDPSLENFLYEDYAAFLRPAVDMFGPGSIVLCPHTAFGMELMPRLSAETSLPCITDVTELELDGTRLRAKRSIYNGKIVSSVSVDASKGALVTVRTGVYQAPDKLSARGTIEGLGVSAEPVRKKTEFIGYREAPAGEVDITQASFLLSIGRGIKDEENIPRAARLAEKMHAVLSCSRPVVDKKWLGKERQVGTSGRTVKPKVYLAMGISGAFQHIAGVKGAGVFIAVNRDPKAPIFRVADYGVVEDMFKLMDALEEKIGGER